MQDKESFTSGSLQKIFVQCFETGHGNVSLSPMLRIREYLFGYGSRFIQGSENPNHASGPLPLPDNFMAIGFLLLKQKYGGTVHTLRFFYIWFDP